MALMSCIARTTILNSSLGASAVPLPEQYHTCTQVTLSCTLSSVISCMLQFLPIAITMLHSGAYLSITLYRFRPEILLCLSSKVGSSTSPTKPTICSNSTPSLIDLLNAVNQSTSDFTIEHLSAHIILVDVEMSIAWLIL